MQVLTIFRAPSQNKQKTIKTSNYKYEITSFQKYIKGIHAKSCASSIQRHHIITLSWLKKYLGAV
jgi:hypothetical protein